MNFYQSVFLEKKTFSKIFVKKSWFWGNYPLIFTLSDQSNGSRNIFKNLDYIYSTNLWSCKKKSKTF